MWSVFHSTSRGFNLVKVVQAQQCAHCFKDDISNTLLLEVLQKQNPDMYTSLSNSLYPKEIIRIKGIRLVRREEAEEKDPNYEVLSGFGEPYRFDFNDGLSFYGYKIPIPPHSDF